MKWTKEIPTQPGYYYIREIGHLMRLRHSPIFIGQIYEDDNFLSFEYGDDYQEVCDRFEYAGLIPEPPKE